MGITKPQSTGEFCLELMSGANTYRLVFLSPFCTYIVYYRKGYSQSDWPLKFNLLKGLLDFACAEIGGAKLYNFYQF